MIPSARLARLIWVLCLLIGTGFHLVDLIGSGGAYPGYPVGTVVFWNALTVLDPVAATLLFWRPRLGVVVTLAIMLTDVAHNVWAVATREGRTPEQPQPLEAKPCAASKPTVPQARSQTA